MTPISEARFLARLGQLTDRALTADALEQQAREAAGTDDCHVITERVGGGRYAKSLRISEHVMPLKPLTRPADAVQLYVVEEV